MGSTGGNGSAFAPGDWTCPGCGDHQFARNPACRRCGTPKAVGADDPSAAAGCGACGQGQFLDFNQFAAAYGGDMGGCMAVMQQMMAMAASAGAGGAANTAGGAARPGDWTCPSCSDQVFAKNDACRKCGTPKPARGGGGGDSRPPIEAKPGDWYCPECNDLQFARNVTCRMCDTPRPLQDALSNITALTNRTRDRSPPRRPQRRERSRSR